MRLRHTPRRLARHAFTLMEMLVVVAIIVVLAGAGGYLYMQRLDESKINTAAAQLKEIEKACMTYKLNNPLAGNFGWPNTLEELTVQQPNGGHPIMSRDNIFDPWGRVYEYDSSGNYNGGLKPDISFKHPESGESIGNWPKTQ